VAPTATAVSVWSWTVDPPLVLLLDAGLLYWVGNWRTVAPRRTTVERRWRTACFYTGLAVVAIALNSPLERLSERLFWAHMVQHVLLLTVAPPLIVLSRPWIRLWRPFPLGMRQAVGRGVAHGGWAGPLRRANRALGAPIPAFVLFAGVLLAWHIPALFDATLRSTPVHVLEHTSFFVTALLFWKQVIHSPPLKIRLAAPQRVAYLVAAMVVGWVLAVVLAVAPDPLYAHYAHEATRPGGISALADQQLAAGVMWVPGSLSLLVAMLCYVYRWVTPPAPARAHVAAAAQLVGDPQLAGDHRP
jgi:putative membrane protein